MNQALKLGSWDTHGYLLRGRLLGRCGLSRLVPCRYDGLSSDLEPTVVKSSFIVSHEILDTREHATFHEPFGSRAKDSRSGPSILKHVIGITEGRVHFAGFVEVVRVGEAIGPITVFCPREVREAHRDVHVRVG